MLFISSTLSGNVSLICLKNRKRTLYVQEYSLSKGPEHSVVDIYFVNKIVFDKMSILRQTACMVFNQVMVNNVASLLIARRCVSPQTNNGVLKLFLKVSA